MNSYGDADVKCPFYNKSDDISISCEGVCGCSVNKTVFRTDQGNFLRQKKKEYMDKFCKGDFESCRLYQMLEGKYEEEA